jgi:two-component system sensor histidine kinase/response regulator
MGSFDVADALGRLNNSKALYKKLLDKFAAGYGDYEGKMRDAFGSGNFDEAMHLSHTMKGLAGNLGATGLQEASLALEQIAKGGAATPELPAALDRFSAKLGDALSEIAGGIDLG